MVNPTNAPQYPWPTALPDQPHPLLSYYHQHLSLYTDVKLFQESRAQLEREYGTRLKAMVAKLREKELEGRRVGVLCVGEESNKAWEDGLESRNTLLTSLSQHLNSIDTLASDHLKLADSLQAQVIDELKKGAEKKEAARRNVKDWVVDLVEEREKGEAAREKAMSKYHQTCTDLESARIKHSRAPRDDKHLPRLLKSYRRALIDKNNARNEYVLAVEVAGKGRERYFDCNPGGEGEEREQEIERKGEVFIGGYGPGIARPQAELQELYASSIKRLNDLLSHSASVYSHFYTGQAQHYAHIITHHEIVDPIKDADFYAEWNVRHFQVPPKVTFQPCAGFLETPTLTLGGGDNLGFDEPSGHPGLGPSGAKGEETIVLQNRLARNRAAKEALRTVCEGWKGEVRRGREVGRAYEANRGLGDPDEIVEVMLVILKNLTLAQVRMDALDVEIELLEEALGDDQGSQKPHDYRNASFAIPTPCDHCKSSIWGIGKPGSSCRKCGSNVHVKCAKKVAAECTGSSASIANKRMSSIFPRRESSSSAPQTISDLASNALSGKEESSLRAIKRSFTSRNKSSPNESPGLSALAIATPVLPPPHRMTDMDNLDTTAIVNSSGRMRPQSLTPSVSQPSLTSPIQRESGTGRRISMFGSPNGGNGPPNGNGIQNLGNHMGRRRSGDVLSGMRGSPGESPVIEEETGGLEPAYPIHERAAEVGPRGPIAKVLFDFEAADSDEISVDKDTIVHVIEPDDGQGWIKVRFDTQGDYIEGLIPAGYVEIQASHTPSQSRRQSETAQMRTLSPQRQPTTEQPSFSPGVVSPVSSPARGMVSPHTFSGGVPRMPGMPGSYIAQETIPPPPIPSNRPDIGAPISNRGKYGQVKALYNYPAAASDEFTLVKGETYDLSMRGASYDAGWWELMDARGKTGISPANYLKRIE